MSKINLYAVTIPPVIRALQNLEGLIGKAVAHAESFETPRHPASEYVEALLNDRLIFDQFTFKRQIQIASDTAKALAARLAGVEIPKYEDAEKTPEELVARIQKTIAFLETISPEQIIGKEEANVAMPYYKDKYLTGFEYATQYALPNFYFHVTTAYSILRKNGLKIGKSDFIGELALH
ncbi:MAG: DUF1993 domain-containing protein [bacterium]|nr:DUF1993 domain-containing protein [bacterium]